MRKQRLVIIDGSNLKVLLSKGLYALVDRRDRLLVTRFKWTADIRADGSKYAYRRSGHRKIYMHRAILKARKSVHVDHANGNGLDNRRLNLRLATRSNNLANMQKHRDAVTSKFKGVSWDSNRRKWLACLTVSRRRVLYKRFDIEVEAARAYDAALQKFQGMFARGNFL